VNALATLMILVVGLGGAIAFWQMRKAHRQAQLPK
jgi:hypothetical protein